MLRTAVLVNDLASITEVELLDDKLPFFEFLECIAHCPGCKVGLLHEIFVGHRTAHIQYFQYRLG